MRSLSLQSGAEPFPGYRLRQRRGTGGYAEVWEAEARDGSLVALKFMPSSDALAAARELRSIRAIREVRHAHLLRIDQVWCQPGYIVICMELADGSLADLHEAYLTEFNALVPPETVCTYLLQAADALDFLNARRHHLDGRTVGYQHCDIKPGNLLLCGDTVKLADFGLATVTATATRTQVRAGTVDYAAPEVFKGEVSDRSDQYSLAVTYHVLRTGYLPYPSGPDRFDPKYVRPEPDLKRLGPAEQVVLRRALSPTSTSRWPTCSSMMRELARSFLPVSAPDDETVRDLPLSSVSSPRRPRSPAGA